MRVEEEGTASEEWQIIGTECRLVIVYIITIVNMFVCVMMNMVACTMDNMMSNKMVEIMFSR